MSLALCLMCLVEGCGTKSPRTNNSGDSQPDSVSPARLHLTGVLMWKGDVSGAGLFSHETVLNPQNVNPEQFGRIADFKVDGSVIAQPLFVSGLQVSGSVHDVVIVATEHDSVYAFDASGASKAPLWERHFAINGITPAPDNFGGRTTLGGEVGITGTPVIDSDTGAMYFVTTQQSNGAVEQYLRAIDVSNGKDFGPGSVQIQATYTGDGQGSQNGQIAFDPAMQNQRAGLVLAGSNVLLAWGAFSDWGVYHGWFMAYDKSKLTQVAVLNTANQYQAIDNADGPADHGGGAAIWQGGAPPTLDSDGDIYVIGADGSFNADQGGTNYGDSVLRLKLAGKRFHVLDWFTPANQACVDQADLEIGSGGLVILPPDATPGQKSGIAVSKEGRLYLLALDRLGKYSPSGDVQIPQQFMIGSQECSPGIGSAFAEGPDWQRLYGNPAYWNGRLYLAASNAPLRQFRFSGQKLLTVPEAQSPTSYGLRGGNVIVTSNGQSGAVLWAYEKNADGHALLHAYDATSVAKELWNSDLSHERDGMDTGEGFAVPVPAKGRIIAVQHNAVCVYGLLARPH